MKVKTRKHVLLSFLVILLGTILFSVQTVLPGNPAGDTTGQTTASQVQNNQQPDPQNSSSQAQTNSEALSYYEQGLKLYYQKDLNQALTLFNKALSLDPNCYQALNAKGATYAFQGRHTEGIDLIKQALTLKPDFEYGHFNLGLANELAGNWNTAISAYQTALRYDSRDAWAYYGIASIYGRQGNVDQTVTYLKQAIDIEPDARETAKAEHDFDPVRKSAKFQALLKPASSTSGANTASSSEKTSSIPVLYYHSVLTQKGNALRVPPEQFEEQMRYLAEHGYNVITIAQLEQHIKGAGQVPPKPFVITFDDGYEDNYTKAFPILQKYRFVATVFMVSDFINGKGYLSAEQLLALQSAGWTIGGHSATHPEFNKVKPEVFTAELKVSTEKLKNILGQDIVYYAYPFGKYNDGMIKELQKEGYRMAFTTKKGWINSRQNLFLLPRVNCYADMGMDEFIKRVTNPDY
ncbi:MAG: polysaccharide deacetylase family protein [Peptococcaceae bacterium]|nr:polysaccharide deacetylase family protein [Peptococcaceae bacterium]